MAIDDDEDEMDMERENEGDGGAGSSSGQPIAREAGVNDGVDTERAERVTSATPPRPFEGELVGVKKKKKAKRGGRQAGMKGSGRAAAAKYNG